MRTRCKHLKVLTVIFLISLLSGTSFSAEKISLAALTTSTDSEFFIKIWAGLRDYFTANNIELQVFDHNLRKEDADTAAAKIIEQKPAVVIAVGAEAARVAKSKINSIPVVFCMIFDPREFAGANMTGVSLDLSAESRLQELKRLLPQAKNIAILYSSVSAQTFSEMDKAAAKLGLQIVGKQIESDSDFIAAFKEVSAKTNCYVMLIDPKIYLPQTVNLLLLQGIVNKYPVIGVSSFYTKAGALASFDCDYGDVGRQAGELTMKIVHGEKPGNLAAVRPRKIHYSLNLITAEKIGVTFPADVIQGASEVTK